MKRSRLTSKGQITIPLAVRERLGLRAGDQVEFVEDDVGVRVQKCITESPFERWRGYLENLAGQDPDTLVEEMRGR